MPVFQILALDPSKRSRCDDSLSLLYLIRGFSRLWTDAKINESDLRIVDGNIILDVRDQIDPAYQGNDTNSLGAKAFLVSVTGDYDQVEPLREPLVEFIQGQSFGHLYVLRDEVSEQIACKLYPYLYRMENLLRGYLIKFMATRIGPTWWQLTASSEMSNKAKIRKKNELVFGRHVDNSAYLIDFDELGELVYEQSSGFLTREDIVNRISNLEETMEAVRTLKQELRTNYQKYFKESFADRDFKNKWKEWEDLRNKIAHNNLFTGQDLQRGIVLAEEILAIIAGAEQSTAKLIITQSEREAIQEQVIAKSEASKAESLPIQSGSSVGYTLKHITEEEFLAELRKQEFHYMTKKDGFVGLTRFVRFHLGELGFDYRTSHEMIERLEQTGKIQVYYVENPYARDLSTAALRTSIT